jgi:hypothetical protein
MTHDDVLSGSEVGLVSEPRVWRYLQAYDSAYTSSPGSAVSTALDQVLYRGGTIVGMPRLRFACAYDDVHDTFQRVTRGGLASDCIVAVGNTTWEPASWVAAEGGNGATTASLFEDLLRRLTDLIGSPPAEDSDASIIVLPRRQTVLFTKRLSVDPRTLPRRKVSYIGDTEDVGDD